MEVIHELFQADAVFDVAVAVDRSLGKRDADPEESGSQNAVVGVVIQLTPLSGFRQRSALKADRVHRKVAFGEPFVEVRAVDQAPLETVRQYTVDIFPSPGRRPAFEARIVEDDPIVQVDSVFERTAVEV